MKLKFTASGSNSMTVAMCKDTVCRSLEAWSSKHDCNVIIEQTESGVVAEFYTDKDFTLFLLTWDTKNLPHRKYKVIS